MTYTASFTCGQYSSNTEESLHRSGRYWNAKDISEWDDRGTECSCMYVCKYYSGVLEVCVSF